MENDNNLEECPDCDGMGEIECDHPVGIPCPSCNQSICETCEGEGVLSIKNNKNNGVDAMIDFNLDEF